MVLHPGELTPLITHQEMNLSPGSTETQAQDLSHPHCPRAPASVTSVLRKEKLSLFHLLVLENGVGYLDQFIFPLKKLLH